MPGWTAIRVTTVVVALVALVAAYQWWNSPERLIQRILDDVASALSHEAADTDLQAIGAVAALQSHLAPDVSIDPGPPTTPVQGRQDVLAMAARVRASRTMMRVRFFDADIDVFDDSTANARVTLQLTTRDGAGAEVASAHLVSVALARPDGQWLVTKAIMLPDPEPAR